jgi:hypothetical protein
LATHLSEWKCTPAAWAEQKAVREIMVFLHSHGVGTARAARISKTYGADAIQVMTENPYRLALEASARWLGDQPDPRDLIQPFPTERMRMWPISSRVNKPENDDPSIVDPIELATDAA